VACPFLALADKPAGLAMENTAEERRCISLWKSPDRTLLLISVPPCGSALETLIAAALSHDLQAKPGVSLVRSLGCKKRLESGSRKPFTDFPSISLNVSVARFVRMQLRSLIETFRTSVLSIDSRTAKPLRFRSVFRGHRDVIENRHYAW